MRQLIIAAALFAVTACDLVDEGFAEGDFDEDGAALIRGGCGDGLCDKWEGESLSCPADCSARCDAGSANTESCNRDRLLDSLAGRMSDGNDRCSVWSGWSANQKQVFYTITDMLAGSYVLHQPVEFRYNTGGFGACCPYGQTCEPGSLPRAGDLIYNQATGEGPGTVNLYYSIPHAGTYCMAMNWALCYDPRSNSACSFTDVARPGSGPYAETMLDHAEELYAMAPSTNSCGGGMVNRLYFGATPELLAELRAVGSPWGYPTWPDDVPAWDRSGDIAGPHSPFTSSLETRDGQPRGQNHFFAGADHVVPVNKPGFVQTIEAENLVEMDIDYNWIHDSNPLCTYSGQTGVQRYNSFWGTRGWPTEPVSPTGCQ